MVHADVVHNEEVPREQERRQVTNGAVEVRRARNEEPRAVPLRERKPGDLLVGQAEVVGGEGEIQLRLAYVAAPKRGYRRPIRPRRTTSALGTSSPATGSRCLIFISWGAATEMRTSPPRISRI